MREMRLILAITVVVLVGIIGWTGDRYGKLLVIANENYAIVQEQQQQLLKAIAVMQEQQAIINTYEALSEGQITIEVTPKKEEIR